MMSPEDEPDYKEITREFDLECEYELETGELCNWNGQMVLDGIQYDGTERFEWECPNCLLLTTIEDSVDD